MMEPARYIEHGSSDRHPGLIVRYANVGAERSTPATSAPQDTIRRKCIQLALKLFPNGVGPVTVWSSPQAFSTSEGAMVIPEPGAPTSLFIYLREVAHFHLDHHGDRAHLSPNAKWRESDRWAYDQMKNARIPCPFVSTHSTRRSQNNV